MQDAKPSGGVGEFAGMVTPAEQTKSQAGSTAEGTPTSLAVNQPSIQAPETPSALGTSVPAAPPMVSSVEEPGKPPPPAPLGMASVQSTELRAGNPLASTAKSSAFTQPIADTATSSTVPSALAAAPAVLGGDVRPAVPPPAAQAGAATGFKEMRVAQILEYAEAAAKFWPIIAGAVAIFVFVYKFFAPASEVRRINCELEWRGVLEQQRSTSVLLSTQIADRADQVTSLARLGGAVASIQADNNTIKLERLRKEIDALQGEAQQQRLSMKSDEKKAGEAIKQTEAELTKCRKSS
jgi:hypothetical protein